MKKQPKSLLEFWRDTDTKDNVYAYLVEFMEQQAVKELFSNESELNAQAVSQAKRYIDLAFENMDVIFNPKVAKREQVNEAR